MRSVTTEVRWSRHRGGQPRLSAPWATRTRASPERTPTTWRAISGLSSTTSTSARCSAPAGEAGTPTGSEPSSVAIC